MPAWRMDVPAERMAFVSALVEQGDIRTADADSATWRNRLRTDLAVIREGECELAINELTEIVRETRAPAAALVLVEAYLHEKQYELALATLNGLQLTAPNCVQAILMKGLVCRECGDSAQARSLLHRAAHLSPHLLLAWRTLMDMALDEDDTHEAARLLGEAIRYHPERGDLMGVQAWFSAAAY